MKHIGKNSLSGFIKILLMMCMAAAVIVVGTLPWVVNWYLNILGTDLSYARTILLIALYPCGILAFFVLNELRRIIGTLTDKNPFVIRNVKSLRRIGLMLVLMFLVFIFKIVTLNTLMTMICSFILMLASMFCFVLADVFNQAVIYKQDIDLTI
jgi:hypothetical protein